jgi:hypothetical protein
MKVATDGRATVFWCGTKADAPLKLAKAKGK